MTSLPKIILIILISVIVLCGCDNRTPVNEVDTSKWAHNIKLAKVKFTPAKSLEIITWHDYIPQDVFDFFFETYGTILVPTFIKSNEEMFDLLKKNPKKYDLVMPSDYMVTRMLKADLLHRLDHRNIHNLELLSEDVRRLKYDRGLFYTVPLFRDSLGIAFNIKYVTGIPRRWHYFAEEIVNEYFAFRVGIRKEMRIAMGVSLMLKGYSPNSINPEEIGEARDLLIDSIQRYGFQLVGPESREKMIEKDILLGLVWSGNATYALTHNTDVRFLLPEEDVIVSYDAIAISAQSDEIQTAELFINYLLTPKVSAKMTNFNYIANCNPSSTLFIKESIRNGPSFVFPNEDDRLFLEDLGEHIDLYEDAWALVLQAKASESLIELPLPKRGIFTVENPLVKPFSQETQAGKNK